MSAFYAFPIIRACQGCGYKFVPTDLTEALDIEKLHTAARGRATLLSLATVPRYHRLMAPYRIALAAFVLFLLPALLPAEEGMWTFDNPPLKQLKEKYNFTPTKEWLDHVRLSQRALERRRLGLVRQPARVAAHQPPRRARAVAKELHAPSTTISRTASTPPRRSRR